jgi:glycosyltransferase involved in cell wall biosynthesis
MRVAYLVPPLGKPNGWRNHAIGFLQAIAVYVEPVLFVAEEDAAAAEALFPHFQRFTLPVVQYPYRDGWAFRGLARTLTALARNRYPQVDLVHSLEAYPAGLVGHWLAARHGTPHLLTAHGTYGVLPYLQASHRLVYRRVLRGARAVCPVSPGTGQTMQAYFGKDLAQTTMRPILNGNDYYRLVSREEALQWQPPAQPTILSVGAVKRRKGYDISLRAFARLQQELPDVRYWIVGDLEHRRYCQELQEMIENNGLQHVSLLGRLSEPELRQRYRQASLFLLTPREVNLHFEGFGLVYLEAGAFGLPVVGSNSGGVSSAIRHGETGFVVDGEDTEALATVLKQLLTDHELARRMGAANRQWAETLTWERNAGEQLAVYQEVLHSANTNGRRIEG